MVMDQPSKDVLKFLFLSLPMLAVLDASGKPPSGILRGNLWWLGEYEECLESEALQSAPFSTAYCSLSIGNESHISVRICSLYKCDLVLYINFLELKSI